MAEAQTMNAPHTVGRPARSRLCRVRIRLCSAHCQLCEGDHWTEPLDAERIDYRHVRITTPDPVWQGAVVNDSDYQFCQE